MKKRISLCLIAVIFASCFMPYTVSAKSITLKEKRARTVTVGKGNRITLKVNMEKKKARWTIKSGKKYVRLSSKKKSSVTVKGIKKGTAKIQCKIDSKKLTCKVKVTDTKKPVKPTLPPNATETSTNAPANTPDVSAVPTVTPTAVPTDRPEITPCPTHIPTEDRLMAEPQKKMDLPYEDENGFPIWRLQGYERYYFFGSDFLRNDINLQFTNTNIVPDEAQWSMDVSEKQNGSVMAWYVDKDDEGAKNVMIGQNGGVVANPNSSYLLCDIKSVSGLEYLYTTDVTDMSYMFLRYAGNNKNLKKFDLGERFETSKVEDMHYMFQYCGYLALEEVYLGRMFDCSNVKDAILMFDADGCSAPDYYVWTEELRNWLTDEENHTGTKYGIKVIVQPQ